jgi:hypothetical protein
VLTAQTGASSSDFGAGPMPAFGFGDIVVAKYAGATGANQWAHRIGGNGEDDAYGVAIDASANIFVAGYTQTSSWSFGSSTMSAQVNNQTAIVLKYSPSGSPIWGRTYGGTTTGNSSFRQIAISGGYPVAVGLLNSSGSYDGTTLTSVGSNDAVVVRTAP